MGRKQLEPHRISYQGKYDDPTRGLRGISLTREEAKSAYYCRQCDAYQGCNLCIDDSASLICSKCHDWANDISERVHGPLVRSPELREEGMRLVRMVESGKIDMEEFNKLWGQARVVLRAPAEEARKEI